MFGWNRMFQRRAQIKKSLLTGAKDGFILKVVYASGWEPEVTNTPGYEAQLWWDNLDNLFFI